MRRSIYTGALFLAIFLVFSGTPHITTAQTTAVVATRAQMLAQIDWLLEQIKILQAQLAAQSEKTPYTYSSNDNYEIVDTFYYGKDFEAIYEVNKNLDLIRRDKITGPRSLDVDLWDMFVNVIGERAAREYITEFRVFNDKESTLGGFVELQPGAEKWIVGFNRDDFEVGNDKSESIYKVLMIHEYAHLVTFYMDNFVEDFEDTFWTAEDNRHAKKLTTLDDKAADKELENYYSNHKNDFVSDYATYSPEEDIAETFVAFVLEKKPVRGFKKEDAKILSMYANPQLLEIRNELRKNLELD